VLVLIVALAVAAPAEASADSVVLEWNTALLQAVRNVRSAPTVVARALAIVHTCMYDAWAAYDPVAVGNRSGDALRQGPSEWTPDNKAIAVSYAAHRALVDLFPSESVAFGQLMLDLGLDPHESSVRAAGPAGIGNAACAAVLEWRHHDGANQLGDMNDGPPYSDYTGYTPSNTADQLRHRRATSSPGTTRRCCRTARAAYSSSGSARWREARTSASSPTIPACRWPT
jgi:hypothetical protein